MEIKLKISPTFVYNESFWGYLRKQSTIIVTNDRLIEKLFGLIKYREILIKDIQNIKPIEKEWIKKGIAAVLIPSGFILTYKKNEKVAKDYIAAPMEQTRKLSNLLKSFKIPVK